MNEPCKNSGPCLCGTLRRASRLVTHVYDEFLRPVGLKVTQFSMLRAIEADAPLSVSELADRLLLERTSCTRNLGLLEKMGIVTLREGEDRRVKLVALSGHGKTVLRRAIPLWERAQEHVNNLFGVDNMPALVRQLIEITDELKER